MINRFLGHFPLRITLIVPFEIIILITAGLIGYLGFRNSQEAVNDVATQLHGETARRIYQQLDSYLDPPLLINNFNLDAIRLQQLDVNDQEAVKHHFLAQMQRFDSIVALTYVSEDPLYYVGIWRGGAYGVDLGFAVLSEETGYIGAGYEVSPQGEIGEQILSLPDYDPRSRPWYRAAIQNGAQTWTPVYMWTGNEVGIDAVVPLYTEDGRLQGVLDTSLTLSGIGNFLQGIQVSEHGQTFIVDETGLLVSSSTILEPYTLSGENVERLSALDAGDPLVRDATRNLLDRFGDWSDIRTRQSFRFDQGGEQHFAHITPYQNDGLRWWIVTMGPESDFMAQINAGNRETMMLIGVSLVISLVVTTVLARRVTRPILVLNHAAKAFAAGLWEQKVTLNRRDEVGELANSFNLMAEQQRGLFTSLAASEARFRAIYERSSDAISVTCSSQFITVNPAYVRMFGYDDVAEILGQSPFNFIAPGERKRIQMYVRLRDQGEVAPTSYETRGLRRDGSEFELENRISRYEMDGIVFTVSILRDITERKQAEQALKQYNDRLQILHEIDRAILSAETSQKIADAALQHIRRLLPVQRASVWINDFQTGERILLATSADRTTQVVGERHPFEQEWLELFGPGDAIVIDDLHTFQPLLPVLSDLAAQGYRSVVLVPLMVQGNLIGAMSLIADQPHACSEDHVQVAREVGDQLAVAIRQAQLLETERDQRTFAEALRDSTTAINRTLALDEVLDHILMNVERVVPHDACNIMLIEDSTAGVVRARGWAERGLGDWIMTVSFGMDEINRWRQLFADEPPQPYTVADTHADPTWQMSAESEWIHSTAKVPIHVAGELIGILNLDSAERDFFTQQHLDRLQALADQAVIAIRNARLYQSEHEQRILAETFRRMAEALSRTAQLDDTLNLVTDQLAQIIDYDQAVVMLVEGEYLRVVAAKGPSRPDEIHAILNSSWPYVDNPLIHMPMTEGQPMVIQDTGQHPLWPLMPLPVHRHSRSWIGMPLVVWGITIGFLSIGSHPARAYRASDAEMVKALAQQVALAIESSRVYAQLETSIISLRQAEANLAQAARLSVAGEIATSIAHQVNNPLTTVIAQTHMLLKRRTPDSPDYQALETIRQAAYRASTVVQRLLSFARPTDYALQPIDVNQSVQYAVSLVRAQIEPHLAHLILQLDPALPIVNGSAQHLEDVWINLILNARDAIGGKNEGVITVSTRVAENGANVEIRVQDNGVGIPPDVLPRIFVPMFTTKLRGSGLGLPVCQEVIQHHGGHIDVVSQVDEGTTFIVSLPCLD